MPRDNDDRDDDDRDDRPIKKGMSAGLIIGIVLGIFALCGGLGIVVLIGLLLPAVAKVREAAVRTQDSNNMKRIGLASSNYEASYGSFPGPFHSEKNKENRNLSWRISMLPFMEQANIYQSLDKSAAWDSPANAGLTSQPIRDFQSPWATNKATADTPYQVFVGPGAIFDDTSDKPTKMAKVTDGLSNTIFAIHATNEVPWAAPRDIKFGPGIPLPPFGDAKGPKGGYNILMTDGSVRWVQNTVSEATLRQLITKDGGEVVSLP
jgi:Protein of unknown function (DUF1559)